MRDITHEEIAELGERLHRLWNTTTFRVDNLEADAPVPVPAAAMRALAIEAVHWFEEREATG